MPTALFYLGREPKFMLVVARHSNPLQMGASVLQYIWRNTDCFLKPILRYSLFLFPFPLVEPHMANASQIPSI